MPRVAVVTGTSRGFGRAVVAELASAGWRVFALSRTAGEGDGHQAGVTCIHHDVSSSDVSRVVEAVADLPVDLLVNNAAVGVPAAALADVDPDRIAAAFDVNVLGPLRLAQALLPAITRAPDPIIVNVSSRLGSLGAQAAGVYADLNTSNAYRITKAAQNMLTIAMAQEFGETVRCWAVHPGTLATGMGRPEARTIPSEAAQRLVRLVESALPESPRFVSLDGPTLDW